MDLRHRRYDIVGHDLRYHNVRYRRSYDIVGTRCCSSCRHRRSWPTMSYALIVCDVVYFNLRCRTSSASCRILYRIWCFILCQFRAPNSLHWAWMVGVPFTDSVPLVPWPCVSGPTATTPCPPIPPGPAGPIPSLAGLPWHNDFLGLLGCNPAQHAEYYGMLCRCRCAAAAVPAPPLLWSSRNSSHPVIQKVSNNEASIISKIWNGWKNPMPCKNQNGRSFVRIKTGWRRNLCWIPATRSKYIGFQYVRNQIYWIPVSTKILGSSIYETSTGYQQIYSPSKTQ